MKIAIITIHNITNFGSVFQAYALQKYLCEQGHDVKIINYNPPYFRRRSVKSMIGIALNFGAYRRRKKKFDDFVYGNMFLTREIRTYEELCAMQIDSVVYIAGGDQLWNPHYDCGKDPAFKLAFLPPGSNKIAFGTSLGQANLSKEYLKQLHTLIKDFMFIGVREKCTIPPLAQLGLKVKHVVDPTLLFPKEFYDKFIKKPQIDNYIFVYLVNKSKLLDDVVEYLSKKLGIKVVECSGFQKKSKADIYLKDVGPKEVLSYLVHATYVLSASFHCTLFSVLYQKQFLTLLPNESTNDRIIDFLSNLELDHRILRKPEDIDKCILDPIDYDNAQRRLCQFLDESTKYLTDVLEKISGCVK